MAIKLRFTPVNRIGEDCYLCRRPRGPRAVRGVRVESPDGPSYFCDVCIGHLADAKAYPSKAKMRGKRCVCGHLAEAHGQDKPHACSVCKCAAWDWDIDLEAAVAKSAPHVG